MNNKNVNGVLVAVMFEEPLGDNFSFFNITAKFKGEFDEFFATVEPMPLVPGGQATPVEIPRYVLESDSEHNAEFSFSKIRFEFRFKDLKDFNLDFLTNKLMRIQSVLSDFTIVPFRIGVVLGGDIQSDESNYLLNKHIVKDSIEDSEEVQLHFRSTLVESKFKLNEWIRYGSLTESNKTNYEIDLNTINPIDPSLIGEYAELISKRLGDFIGNP